MQLGEELENKQSERVHKKDLVGNNLGTDIHDKRQQQQNTDKHKRHEK